MHYRYIFFQVFLTCLIYNYFMLIFYIPYPNKLEVT